MNFRRLLTCAYTLALMLVLAPMSSTLQANAPQGCGKDGDNFDCTGDGNCSIDMDTFDADVATELGLNWTVDTQTNTVIVAVVDYKELANALFCSPGLDNPSNTDINQMSRIVVESEDCVNMFPANVCVYIYMKIQHCGETYRLVGDTADEIRPALKLCSVETIDSFPPAPGQVVTYKVADDATFSNVNDPSDTITIKAGSTVDMNHN
jgi:hypothetical protein